MQYIHKALDTYTMYQTVVTALLFLVFCAFVFTLTGFLPYTAIEMTASLVVIVSVALATHYVLATVTKAPANVWSTVVTALIVFLLFSPSAELRELAALAFVSFVAIASKYIVQYRKLHVANPVAFAAVVCVLAGVAYATWWVSALYLAPVILIAGFLVVTKIRRVPMILSGISAALIVVTLQAFHDSSWGIETYSTLLLSTPLLFFMFFMVSEPLTTPAGTKAQLFYGAFIGVLVHIPFTIGPLYSSPELALLIANVLAYPLSLKGRLTLVCEKVTKIAKDTYEFSFTPSFSSTFTAGQYLEWALPHQNPDGRGTRRYFTIASSPTEEDIKLAVRVDHEHGSSYKKALQEFSEGSVIHATQLAGDFVLPKDVTAHKYVFIAGGIGITPFRSHIQYLIDTQQSVDAHLYYCNNSVADRAYGDLFAQAQQEIGLSCIDVIAKPDTFWSGESGYITAEMLAKYTPDIKERLIYISGPPGMVGAYSKLLRSVGVPQRNIKTDYFPGLA